MMQKDDLTWMEYEFDGTLEMWKDYNDTDNKCLPSFKKMKKMFGIISNNLEWEYQLLSQT